MKVAVAEVAEVDDEGLLPVLIERNPECGENHIQL